MSPFIICLAVFQGAPPPADDLKYPGLWAIDGKYLIGKGERADSSSFHSLFDHETQKKKEIPGAPGSFQHLTTFSWTVSKGRVWSLVTHGTKSGFYDARLVESLEVKPLDEKDDRGRMTATLEPYRTAVLAQALERKSPSRVYAGLCLIDEKTPELLVLSSLPPPKRDKAGEPIFAPEDEERPVAWNISFHRCVLDPTVKREVTNMVGDWKHTKSVTCPFSEPFLVLKLNRIYYFVTTNRLYAMNADDRRGEQIAEIALGEVSRLAGILEGPQSAMVIGRDRDGIGWVFDLNRSRPSVLGRKIGRVANVPELAERVGAEVSANAKKAKN